MENTIIRTAYELKSISDTKLIIYLKKPVQQKAISVEKELAAELKSCDPRIRTRRLEQIFCKVLDSLPQEPLLTGLDVLFNPDYKIDVLKMLCSAYKHKPFSIVWPGASDDSHLYYAEEGYQDYKSYEIKNYNVFCVRIGGNEP